MKNKGFTLIELLIVVALIMILATVSLGAYNMATTRSKDTQRKNDLAQIVKAVESFANDVGRYPISDGSGNMLCYKKALTVVTNPVCIGGNLTNTIDALFTTYIVIPTDPDRDYKYYYESDASGSTYAIYAYLQNKDDRDLILDVDGKVVSYDKSCGTDMCNYKITEVGLIK